MSRTPSIEFRSRRPRIAAISAACALAVAGIAIPGLASSAVAVPMPASSAAKLTNLSHLDFLLGTVPLLSGIANHTTYNESSEAAAEAPWVYANHKADGSFQRVGGGDITDAAKGYYAQGSYDA